MSIGTFTQGQTYFPKGTFNIFVGASNETGILDIDRITNIIGKYGDFTLMRGIGVWQGDREDSAIVTVSGKELDILEAVSTLKIELNQDSIGIQRIPEIEFI